MAQDPAVLRHDSDLASSEPVVRQWRPLLWRVVPPILALGIIGFAILVLQSPHAGIGAGTSSVESLTGGARTIPKTGSPAPNFEVASLNGESLKLEDYRGKVVLLNFWATWCIPCRTELPEFSKVYREQQDQGFVVLAVDLKESDSDVRSFLSEIPVPFPVAMDRDGSLANRYAVTALPTSFFIDQDGIIRGIFVGNLNRDAVAKKLEQMAANRSADPAK